MAKVKVITELTNNNGSGIESYKIGSDSQYVTHKDKTVNEVLEDLIERVTTLENKIK